MSRWKMRFWILLIAVLSLTACSGSRDLTSSSSKDLTSSRDMTRPRALALISQAEKKGIGKGGDCSAGGAQVSAQIETGTCPGPCSNGKREVEAGADRVFQDMGLIELRPAKCPQLAGPVYDGCEAVLTAKGRPLIVRDSCGSPAVVTALGRDITAVTGVAKQGENEATADFTWKWGLTPVGEAFAKANVLIDGADNRYVGASNSDPRSPNHEGSGQAAFRLYDDGWRVVQLEFQ